MTHNRNHNPFRTQSEAPADLKVAQAEFDEFKAALRDGDLEGTDSRDRQDRVTYGLSAAKSALRLAIRQESTKAKMEKKNENE